MLCGRNRIIMRKDDETEDPAAATEEDIDKKYKLPTGGTSKKVLAGPRAMANVCNVTAATDLRGANLSSSEHAHVTGTALQQYCIMFEFECQGRNLHKKREKHFLLDAAPLRAMQRGVA